MNLKHSVGENYILSFLCYFCEFNNYDLQIITEICSCLVKIYSNDDISMGTSNDNDNVINKNNCLLILLFTGLCAFIFNSSSIFNSCFVFFQKNLREAEDLVDDGVRDKSRLSIAVEDGLDKVKVEAFLDCYPLDSCLIYDYCIYSHYLLIFSLVYVVGT